MPWRGAGLFPQSVQDCVENKILLEKMAANGISDTTFNGLPTRSHWDFHQPIKQNFNIKVSKSYLNGINRCVNIPWLNALYNRSNLGYCLSENCHNGLNHWRLLFPLSLLLLFTTVKFVIVFAYIVEVHMDVQYIINYWSYPLDSWLHVVLNSKVFLVKIQTWTR